MRKYFYFISVLIFSVFFQGFFLPAFCASKPGKTSMPSYIKKPDAFKNDKPTEFKFDPSKLKEVTFFSCGDQYKIAAYQQEPALLLVPLSDENIVKVLEKFGASAKYSPDDREIVFSRDNKYMTMKVDYDTCDFNGEKRAIPVPPRIIKGMVYISPNSFSKFIWAAFLYDDKRDRYYLDPFLLDVKLETSDRGLTKVVAWGTGPFKNRILKLKDPTRFVIDVMNSCLDGKAREIQHPTLGAIRFSQNDLKGEEGNIVRIVIPESEEYEIALAEPRAPNYVEAELRKRNINAPVQDLAVQKIENVKVYEKEDLVTIIMETSGPVQLQWSRLLSPDDRFFIDVPGVIFPEKKKEFTLGSSFLPSVRVAQNQPAPDPKVRLVLPLDGPRKVTITPDEEKSELIKIFVSAEKIDTAQEPDNGFVVSWFKPSGQVICIDPGHGGSDPGAVNRSLGLSEKNITLDIANRLKKILQKEGWSVIMTRNSDRDVSYAGSPAYVELGDRCSIANDLKANAFISIHINASVNSSTNGFSTWWYKTTDKFLAQCIQSAMVKDLSVRDLGIRRERFYVLRHTNMPAALVEAGFISNPTEAKFLSQAQFRQKIAESIFKGLKNYFGTMKSK